MDFRILGSLQVWDGEQEIPVGGGKQRALLALLLVHANRSVSEDILIDGLWGETASPRAADNLHVLVSRLRRVLGSDRIVREGGGYLIRVEADELDVERFEQLRADSKFREALELWRGAPLSDFTYDGWAANEIRRLEELHAVVLEERIDADLASGRHAELVGELRALVGEHPLRENLRRLLIIALYRSGRQAEALDAYRDARRMLDEELGLEPSPALRELEGSVLRHDASLEPPLTSAPVRGDDGRSRSRLILAAATAALIAFGAAAAAFQFLERESPQQTAAATLPETGVATERQVSTRPKPATTERVARAVRKAPPRKTHPSTPSSAPRRRPAPPPPPPPPPPPSAPSPPPAPPAPPPQPAPKKPQPRPKPKPKPAPPVALVRISDNFDDGLFDRATWYRSSSTGVTIEEQGGRLEVSVQPDAVAEGDYKLISASYGTTCRYLGDFDARIEFELLEWPEANGVVVQLAAWFNDTNVGAVRQSQTWAEEYASWMTNRGRSNPSADGRGTLRVRRVGDRITTYFRRAQDWYPLQSERGYTGAPIIGIQTMSKDEWFADKPVRIAFDNFSLTAAKRAC